MAKFIVLAAGILLALLLGRILRQIGTRGRDAEPPQKAKLVRCPACESYHPEGEPCDCAKKS